MKEKKTQSIILLPDLSSVHHWLYSISANPVGLFYQGERCSRLSSLPTKLFLICILLFLLLFFFPFIFFFFFLIIHHIRLRSISLLIFCSTWLLLKGNDKPRQLFVTVKHILLNLLLNTRLIIRGNALPSQNSRKGQQGTLAKPQWGCRLPKARDALQQLPSSGPQHPAVRPKELSNSTPYSKFSS